MLPVPQVLIVVLLAPCQRTILIVITGMVTLLTCMNQDTQELDCLRTLLVTQTDRSPTEPRKEEVRPAHFLQYQLKSSPSRTSLQMTMKIRQLRSLPRINFSRGVEHPVALNGREMLTTNTSSVRRGLINCMVVPATMSSTALKKTISSMVTTVSIDCLVMVVTI